MMTLSVTRTRPLPRALTHPSGIVFLPPNLRVSTEELNRQDAQWRALREAAYSRAWAEDATLVGSIVSYGNGEAGAERRGSTTRRKRRKKALMKLIKWMEMGASGNNGSGGAVSTNSNSVSYPPQPRTSSADGPASSTPTGTTSPPAVADATRQHV